MLKKNIFLQKPFSYMQWQHAYLLLDFDFIPVHKVFLYCIALCIRTGAVDLFLIFYKNESKALNQSDLRIQ